MSRIRGYCQSLAFLAALGSAAFAQDGAAGRVLVFFIMLIFGSLIAAAGGAIGAAYFRKDVPPALGGPIQPPPLP